MKFNFMALAFLLAAGSSAFAQMDLEQNYQIPSDIQNELDAMNQRDAMKQRNEQSSVVPKQDVNALAQEQANVRNTRPEENGFLDSSRDMSSDDSMALDQLGFDE